MWLVFFCMSIVIFNLRFLAKEVLPIRVSKIGNHTGKEIKEYTTA